MKVSFFETARYDPPRTIQSEWPVPGAAYERDAGLQAHCHGAGGIGQFFLWLNRLSPDPRYREAAAGAARTLAVQRQSETRSGLCHGLSGTGHVLLDSYQALDDPRWLSLAGETAAQLQTFRRPASPRDCAGAEVDGADLPAR